MRAPLSSRLVIEAAGACALANASDDKSIDLPSLSASTLSGHFGARELTLLEHLLITHGSHQVGIVRELVAEALKDIALVARGGIKLSKEEEEEAASLALAADERRERRRDKAFARAAHREYDELARNVGGGAALRAEKALSNSAAGLFGAQGGAALGGGLVIAIISAAFFGFYLGGSIWGHGSAGVSIYYIYICSTGMIIGRLHLIAYPPPLPHTHTIFIQAYAAAAFSSMATLMLEGILLVLRLSRSENILRRRRNIATVVTPLAANITSPRDSDVLPLSSIPIPAQDSTTPSPLDDGLRLRATMKR